LIVAGAGGKGDNRRGRLTLPEDGGSPPPKLATERLAGSPSLEVGDE